VFRQRQIWGQAAPGSGLTFSGGQTRSCDCEHQRNRAAAGMDSSCDRWRTGPGDSTRRYSRSQPQRCLGKTGHGGVRCSRSGFHFRGSRGCFGGFHCGFRSASLFDLLAMFGQFFLQKPKLFLLHLKCLAAVLPLRLQFPRWSFLGGFSGRRGLEQEQPRPRLHLSVSLSVNQQTQFRWQGTAIVRVMRVFSRPLSF
jgi:hypothetical protein